MTGFVSYSRHNDSFHTLSLTDLDLRWPWP